MRLKLCIHTRIYVVDAESKEMLREYRVSNTYETDSENISSAKAALMQVPNYAKQAIARMGETI